jgi:hypothetical protein
MCKPGNICVLRRDGVQRNGRRHNGVGAAQASNAENDNYVAKTTVEHPKRPLTSHTTVDRPKRPFWGGQFRRIWAENLSNLRVADQDGPFGDLADRLWRFTSRGDPQKHDRSLAFSCLSALKIFVRLIHLGQSSSFCPSPSAQKVNGTKRSSIWSQRYDLMN